MFKIEYYRYQALVEIDTYPLDLRRLTRSVDDILSDDNELVYAIKLPPPTLQILGNIENMMHTMTISAAGRDSLAKFILTEDYILKLLPLLETAEDMEMLPELFVLCRIMKTIILLNDSTIIEYIVTDEVVMGVVGTLECLWFALAQVLGQRLIE